MYIYILAQARHGTRSSICMACAALGKAMSPVRRSSWPIRRERQRVAQTAAAERLAVIEVKIDKLTALVESLTKSSLAFSGPVIPAPLQEQVESVDAR